MSVRYLCLLYKVFGMPYHSALDGERDDIRVKDHRKIVKRLN